MGTVSVRPVPYLKIAVFPASPSSAGGCSTRPKLKPDLLKSRLREDRGARTPAPLLLYDRLTITLVAGGLRMRTTISVGLLILADWLKCSAQVLTARPQNVQSPVRIARGKSEMDGKHWTILSISAKNAYENAFGIAVRPELRLECVQQGNDSSFLIVMESGPHENTPNEYDRLRVKLDENQPEEEGWYELSDHKSWRHDPSTDAKFLIKVLAAKAMLIEFRPFMLGGIVESKFNVSGLRQEFDKYAECKAGPAFPGGDTQPQTGTLKLLSGPGIIVFIDGQQQKGISTPAIFELPAGEHKIKLLKPSAAQEFIVEIRRGQVTTKDVFWLK